MPDIRHILHFVIDDLRPELNCFGKTKLRTPHIDALAARSTRYERAMCNFPQCMPSRSSFMAGKRPPHFVNWSNMLLTGGQPTLPAFLKQHGFKTISCGKIYHEPLDDAFHWDELHQELWRSKPHGRVDINSHDYQLPENQQKTLYKQTLSMREIRSIWEPLPPLYECADAADDGYADHRIASSAIDALQRHHASSPDQPLFLNVGFVRPHLPWTAPKWAWDLYDRDQIDLADNPFLPEDAVGYSNMCDFMHYGDQEVQEKLSDIGRYAKMDEIPQLSEDKQRECIHAYWAAVSFMDAQVGRVMAELERLGMTEETAVVFWGDNGWHLGEHALWSKITNFEESNRVPLLVCVPGETAGETTRHLVEMVDVYPTVCDLLGLDPPDHLEGKALAYGPALQTIPDDAPSEAFVVNHGAKTIITDRYRLTFYTGAGDNPQGRVIPDRGAFELFDHSHDPRENKNVARDPAYAEVKEQLWLRLQQVYGPHPQNP